MSRPRLPLGCAIVATAAVMFPAGLWVAGTLRSDPAAKAAPTRAPAPRTPMRNPYSATIRTDPHVLEAQRVVVEAMERACRADRRQCAEAAAARRYLEARAGE